jgi:hypothetical protein
MHLLLGSIMLLNVVAHGTVDWQQLAVQGTVRTATRLTTSIHQNYCPFCKQNGLHCVIVIHAYQSISKNVVLENEKAPCSTDMYPSSRSAPLA